MQVEVEEQELDGDGKVLNTIQKQRKQIRTAEETDEMPAAPSSCIRDSSRNQLHRLGALYSNPQDLSSPVHRTETAFAIEREPDHDTRSATKLKKSKKLAELANSYNQWEDESVSKNRTPKPSTSQQNDNAATASPHKVNDNHLISGIKPISASPRKFSDKTATASILNRIESLEKRETDNNKNSNNKKLNWDKGIMDSLESQGFKRRDTTHKRLEYDFNHTDRKQINTKFSNAAKPPLGSAAIIKGAIPKNAPTTVEEPARKVDVTKGLVSGRAAIFETSAPRATNNASSSSTAAAKNQKDPAEMSLKERMALFERNKGEALMPKAALGMAPSTKQIMSDKKPSENVKQVITTPQQPMTSSAIASVAPTANKINNFNRPVRADTCAAGSGIRQTVAALLSAPATIAESRIANENRKIREQEMNVVLNRFNSKADEAVPPPAPPMPDNLFKTNSAGRKKRLSGTTHFNFIRILIIF